MVKSRQKTPIFGNACCNSKKNDRSKANRVFRHRAKMLMSHGEYDLLPKKQRECSEIWTFGKDGKSWWKPDRFTQPEKYKYWQTLLRR